MIRCRTVSKVWSIGALRAGDRFSLDEGRTWHTAAAGRDGAAIAVGGGDSCVAETVVVIPEGRVDCLLEVVLIEVPLAFSIEIDRDRWARAYGVARDVEVVEADVRAYFDPPWIPPHLFGTVAVKSVKPSEE